LSASSERKVTEDTYGCSKKKDSDCSKRSTVPDKVQ
jgi:hypothetical protein